MCARTHKNNRAHAGHHPGLTAQANERLPPVSAVPSLIPPQQPPTPTPTAAATAAAGAAGAGAATGAGLPAATAGSKLEGAAARPGGGGVCAPAWRHHLTCPLVPVHAAHIVQQPTPRGPELQRPGACACRGSPHALVRAHIRAATVSVSVVCM